MKPVKKVVIGRLLFNKGLAPFFDCMARMLPNLMGSDLVDECKVLTTDNFSVDMARNWIVQQALVEIDADAVIWLDTDMIFPDDTLLRLVSMANAGYYIAAGIYRKGRPPYQLLTELTWGDEAATVEQLDALALAQMPVPVAMTAGGFSIVRTEVYKAIHAKIGLPWYCNWDFVSGRQAVGEDRFFLLRAAEVGVTPVVDPYLCAVHWPPFSPPVPVREGQAEMRWVE